MSVKKSCIGLALCMGTLGSASVAHAGGMAEADRWVRLPASLFTSNASMDLDRDGLRDDLENRLADTWRPYFEFDEAENNKANTSELSLQSWEPRVIFAVHKAKEQQPYANYTVRAKYGFLFRMDGGYRRSNWCTNYHSGDAQAAEYEFISMDGINWRLDRVKLASGWVWTGTGSVLQLGPRTGNIGGAGFDRPLPKVYMSAGKHHQYYTASSCEAADLGICDDDCGGGAKRIGHLMVSGYWTNVGDYLYHPSSSSTNPALVNRPFLNYLANIGYPNETVWANRWYRAACGYIFTGGMNSAPGNTGAWQPSSLFASLSASNTCVTSVRDLFINARQ